MLPPPPAAPAPPAAPDMMREGRRYQTSKDGGTKSKGSPEIPRRKQQVHTGRPRRELRGPWGERERAFHPVLGSSQERHGPSPLGSTVAPPTAFPRPHSALDSHRPVLNSKMGPHHWPLPASSLCRQGQARPGRSLRLSLQGGSTRRYTVTLKCSGQWPACHHPAVFNTTGSMLLHPSALPFPTSHHCSSSRAACQQLPVTSAHHHHHHAQMRATPAAAQMACTSAATGVAAMTAVSCPGICAESLCSSAASSDLGSTLPWKQFLLLGVACTSLL